MDSWNELIFLDVDSQNLKVDQNFFVGMVKMSVANLIAGL